MTSAAPNMPAKSTRSDMASVPHILLVAYEALGHTQPLCALAARIVKARSCAVTAFTTPSFYERVHHQLSLSFADSEEELRSMISVLALPKQDTISFDIDSFDAAFASVYSAFVRLQPVECVKTRKTITARSAPDVVILDLFAYEPMCVISDFAKQEQRPCPKIYSWVTCSASAFYCRTLSLRANADGKLQQTIQARLEGHGTTPESVLREIFSSQKGSVVSVPGFPPFFDYEGFPQKPVIEALEGGELFYKASLFLHRADGVVFSSPLCYEAPELMSAIKQHTKETGTSTYNFGPLLPSGDNVCRNRRERPEPEREVISFMDRILVSNGAKSLVFISFGTIWWCTEPERIWVVLETLVELGRPFIFSHASPFAEVPKAVIDLVNKSGIGYMSKWVPQQEVLNHPVTGWFLTHAGMNSIIESISAGIPMICWPYQADQPLNTLETTENHKIAYELLSVRTNHLDRPLHRTGAPAATSLNDVREEVVRVLTSAYGQDGEAKRRSAQELRCVFEKCWEQGGSSQSALEEFLRDL